MPFSTVCFRFRPAHVSEGEIEALNTRILEQVNRSGEAFLSPTRLNDRYSLRLAIGNIRTTEAHVRRVWELLQTVSEMHEGGSGDEV